MLLTIIIIATLFIASLSLTGIVILTAMKKHVHATLMPLVALAAGAMFGNALLHLLPEALERSEGIFSVFSVMLFVVASFVASFLFEQFFFWHHCHNEEICEPTQKPFAHLVLYSDAIHNFIDGLIVAAAFIVSVPLGITTTLTIALHEVPQELGDFAVLIHGGFSKMRAAILNGIVSLTVVLGGIAGLMLAKTVVWAVPALLPIAAGGFIYIAAADLLPELRHHNTRTGIPLSILFFLTGLAIMILTALIE